MRFLRKGSSATEDAGSDAIDVGEESAESHMPRSQTPKKGRPTPSRRDAEGKKRGPAAPPPKTTREAIKRSRELRKANPMAKDERKAIRREQRERMMAGDDKYLLPRDRGPVKAFVRDAVDSRRNLIGLFMPLALIVFASLLVPNPNVQRWTTLLCMVMLIAMSIEAFFNGKRIARMARERFPDETIKGRSIGWYVFIRSSQIRKLRVPKPRVKAGDPIPAK